MRAQIDYYNREWSIAERSYPGPRQLQRCIAILREIAALRLQRPSICELGSGTGWLTAMLGNIGDALGVDLSSVAVEAASRRFSHVRFVCADVLRWDYPPEEFDIAVSHEVIEHVDDQARYVDVAWGILKAGGRLVLTTPNLTVGKHAKIEVRSHQPNEHWLTAPQLRGLLLRRFRNVRVRTIILGGATQGIYRIVNAQRVHHLLRRFNLYDAYEEAAARAGMGLHLIATADKV
ncbi:MAG: class I SAM-dependent methyltransferase [Candidatus Eremiobacteraeota bacterium]|nr:class I SAM-dependent methyltransferase [Candidatus Eremiobacteraeota bacterium]